MVSVLFVCSGNSNNFNIVPFIYSQGESLRSLDLDIQYFTINKKGIFGYISTAYKLRKYLENNEVDIIHAHYTLSGWTAVLTFTKKPIVLSLMGTDAYGEYIDIKKRDFFSRYLMLLTILIQPFVKSIICKSKNIEKYVIQKKKSFIIPNGIDLDKIRYYGHHFKEELGLDLEKKYILFLGNKKNKRKNYKLLKSAYSLIDSDKVKLISPYPISHDEVVKYLNSVDVLVLPSFMEGSPNVVKEAMACNCPIVATDVGDTKWIIGKTFGCYLSSFDNEDMAQKIKRALEFGERRRRTKGRERIIKLGLSSDLIAKKIFQLYDGIIKEK